MKNKGFTLAELLGVLVVLSLLSIIVVPSVTDMLNDYKTKICVIQFDNIIEASKSWAADNFEKLPETEESDDYKDVSLNTLIKYGYLDDDIDSPKIDEELKNSLVVRIQKYKKKYLYKVYDIGDETDTEDDKIIISEEFCK